MNKIDDSAACRNAPRKESGDERQTYLELVKLQDQNPPMCEKPAKEFTAAELWAVLLSYAGLLKGTKPRRRKRSEKSVCKAEAES